MNLDMNLKKYILRYKISQNAGTVVQIIFIKGGIIRSRIRKDYSCVPDPWHFDTDPGRVMLFSSVTLKMTNANKRDFCLIGTGNYWKYISLEMQQAIKKSQLK